MLKNMKKLTSLVLAMLMCLALCVPAFAVEDAQATQQIYNIVEAINAQDWETFVSFSGDADYEMDKAFFFNEENARNHQGLFNVLSAEVAELYPVELQEAAKYSRILDETNENADSQLSAYMVGLDCHVYEETKYFFNGMNYLFFVMGMENGEWKCLQMSSAALELLESCNTVRSNGNSDLAQAIQNVAKRSQGIYTNAAGEVIENNRDVTYNNSRTSEFTPPTSVRVYMTADGTVRAVNFTTYMQNVLPNEWIGSWPQESLRAGAMAVKTYGWYCVLYPDYEKYGADVKDDVNSQVYKPGTSQTDTNNAIRDTSGAGMHNSAGEIFRAEYRAGTSGQAGTQYSGQMQQWGTKYLAEDGYYYNDICHYYYDYSSLSSGAIVIFIM